MPHAARVPHGSLPVQYLPTMVVRAVLLLLALAFPLSAGAAPVDPLWTLAVEASGRAARWSPGEMRLAIEMADEAGKVLETWDNRYRLSVDGSGVVRTEVVSAIHNGKDETEKEGRAQEKREGDSRSGGSSPMAGFGDDPFAPGVQDTVQVRRLDGTRVIAGRACIGYDFTIAKPKNATVAGTAWLDAATGFPVEYTSAPSPLPPAVHEMSTVVRYAAGRVSEVRVEGSGSILFIRRRFVSVISFAGWFERPQG
jgi:hypothetical protein